MSRIGKKPVPIPAGVKVALNGAVLAVEGPKGKLSLQIHPKVKVEQKDGTIAVQRTGETREDRAFHGLYRALVNNLLIGVSKGFERKLEIVGVGYGAQIKGKKISLTVGYSEQVELDIPEGVKVDLPDATHVNLSGPDKQKVGQFAAVIRAVRKPEPYKGTGIKYSDEQVRRKAGKAFGSAG